MSCNFLQRKPFSPLSPLNPKWGKGERGKGGKLKPRIQVNFLPYSPFKSFPSSSPLYVYPLLLPLTYVRRSRRRNTHRKKRKGSASFKAKAHKSPEQKAKPQRVVTQRSLHRVQYFVLNLSRLQRICLPQPFNLYFRESTPRPKPMYLAAPKFRHMSTALRYISILPRKKIPIFKQPFHLIVRANVSSFLSD